MTVRSFSGWLYVLTLIWLWVGIATRAPGFWLLPICKMWMWIWHGYNVDVHRKTGKPRKPHRQRFWAWSEVHTSSNATLEGDKGSTAFTQKRTFRREGSIESRDLVNLGGGDREKRSYMFESRKVRHKLVHLSNCLPLAWYTTHNGTCQTYSDGLFVMRPRKTFRGWTKVHLKSLRAVSPRNSPSSFPWSAKESSSLDGVVCVWFYVIICVQYTHTQIYLLLYIYIHNAHVNLHFTISDL